MKILNSLFTGLAFIGLALAVVTADEPKVPGSVVAKDVRQIVLATHNGEAVIELSGVGEANLAALRDWPADDPRWRTLLVVHVQPEKTQADKSQAGTPVLWGRFVVVENRVRFAPRFPLQPGLKYQVAFHPESLPVPGKTGAKLAVQTTTVALPKAVRGVETRVTAVYPTAETLPENLLRFYLHFSAPMSQGEAYDHLRLVDSEGKELEMPFLELAEELWEPEHQRFTLLIHPGHIKKGLRSREESGTALMEGRKYTLVISKGWADAKGEPLAAEFRKTFKVGPEEKRALDFETWKLSAPVAGKREPVELRVPKPLDQALLERMIWISDALGERVEGAVSLADKETRWTFTPSAPWSNSEYLLNADTTLEDPCGNNLQRAFDFNSSDPLAKSNSAKLATRRFKPRMTATSP